MRKQNKIKDIEWCELDIIWELSRTNKVKRVTMHFNDHLKIRHVKLRFPQQGIYKITFEEKQSRYDYDDNGKRLNYKESQLDTWLNFMDTMREYQEEKPEIEVLLSYLLSLDLGNVIVSFEGFFNKYVKDFDVILKGL